MPSPPLAFRRRALAAWAAGSLLPAAAPALAQETTYPSRPVRLLVGFAAGSASDLIARPLAQKLSERLGQPVTVENRPGANGVLASEAVARAAPDGHTLLLGTFSQTVVTPLLRSDLPYDTERDLAPVAGVVQPPLVVAVPADLPARSLGELVALARARPGQLNMGSAGSGDLGHLALELLKRRMGFDIVHVPYRGSGPALQDMLGGRVQLMISPYIVMKGPAEAGQVRVLAVTSSERLPALPDVPTVAEAGARRGSRRRASSASTPPPRRRAPSWRASRRRRAGRRARRTCRAPTPRRGSCPASPARRSSPPTSRASGRSGGG